MDELNGKVCAITGGAGGIGLAIAERLAQAGMRIALADVEPSALDDAVAHLGGDALGVCCDVTSQESMDDFAARTVEHFGAVHVACLNAGVAPVGTILETDLETWRWVIDVNVLGVVHGIRSFAPLLVAQGEGHVVCTASLAGLSTTYALGAYSASKHAVVGIAATLRAELEPTGVGVSVLCPGPFRTRIFDSERHRPAEGGDDGDPAPTAVKSAYRRAVARSADPSIVADAVHRAILANSAFVLPSPEVDGAIIQRIDDIQAAMSRTER